MIDLVYFFFDINDEFIMCICASIFMRKLQLLEWLLILCYVKFFDDHLMKFFTSPNERLVDCL